MGAVATLDPDAFRAAYPEFSDATDDRISGYFLRAGLYLANDGTGPVSDVATQGALLGLLTAHIAKLSGAANPPGSPPGPQGLVGRISSASEGSVSVSSDLSGVSPSAAWFTQTSYGFEFWQATARFRRARFVPGPPTTAPWAGPWGYPIGGGIRGW